MIKKELVLIFGLLLAINGFSQNTFVKGYFIKNSNEKIDCLIKNDDWLNNPTEFKYKLNENSEKQTITIDSIKEFGVINKLKYVRHSVDIDRSSKIPGELDNNKNPIFKNEQLFLKVLIEGKANLYYYEDQGLVRFFFNNNPAEVKQLIFKHYLIDAQNWSINKEFRRQLWNTLKCESISMNSLKKIDYNKSDLVELFRKYNKCHNSDFVYYQKNKKNTDSFNLNIRAGIRSSSLVLVDPRGRQLDFGKNLTSFRLGLEAEFIFGFNNNKWAFLLEPTYHQFQSDTQSASFMQKRIELNIGLRHYMYLKNKDVKLFMNASAVYANSFNSELTERNNLFSIPIDDSLNMVLGVGGKYKDRFSLEFRYSPRRNFYILDSGNEVNWHPSFQSLSIVLGYTLF